MDDLSTSFSFFQKSQEVHSIKLQPQNDMHLKMNFVIWVLCRIHDLGRKEISIVRLTLKKKISAKQRCWISKWFDWHRRHSFFNCAADQFLHRMTFHFWPFFIRMEWSLTRGVSIFKNKMFLIDFSLNDWIMGIHWPVYWNHRLMIYHRYIRKIFIDKKSTEMHTHTHNQFIS